MRISSWMGMALFALLAAACEGGGATVDEDAGNTMMMDTCNGTTLCERSLGECGVTTITMEDCEGFYEPATSSCSDIAAYEACNCQCNADNPASCGAWFACGEDCFSTHCM